jgi:hypothetical protein
MLEKKAWSSEIISMLVARANNNERNKQHYKSHGTWSTHMFLLIMCNVQAQIRDESNHDSNLIILRFPSYPLEIRC